MKEVFKEEEIMIERGEESSAELIPGLPLDIALICLFRLHHSSHDTSSQVCRRWRNLIKSKYFYYQRRRNGLTRKTACMVQILPGQTESTSSKPSGQQQPRYGLSLFDPDSGSWTRLDPIPGYPEGLPLFCQVASTEGKLVVLGGWEPLTCKPVRDVHLYDFAAARWRRCADMPQTTSFFAAAASEGKVYVAGGHDEGKNALRSSWVFDVEKDEWSDLGEMSEERDECEGLVIGSEFWVISGYGTEAQGAFKASADVYDIPSGAWRRVDGAWPASGKSPRGCIGWAEGAGFVRWDELEPGARVGTCGVEIGDRVLVSGSDYQGGQNGFYVASKEKSSENQERPGKLVKIECVPEEFSGVVQSACCVEI